MVEELYCPYCDSPLISIGRAILKCERCNVTMPRIAFFLKHNENIYEGSKCHDCGCNEGEIHEYSCDMEVCPYCGGQLCSCNCIYEKLGYAFDPNKEFSNLPQEVYENGVSDEEKEKFIKMLEEKGRIPFLAFPSLCRSCGKRNSIPIMWDDFAKIPSIQEIMQFFTEKPENLRKVALYKSLCISCFLILRDQGEEYLSFPDHCEYCGSAQPEYKIESDKIERRAQGKYLCEKCYSYIKNLLHLEYDMPRKTSSMSGE